VSAPVSAIEHLRPVRGDGNWYATKFRNNPQSVRVLATDRKFPSEWKFWFTLRVTGRLVLNRKKKLVLAPDILGHGCVGVICRPLPSKTEQREPHGYV